MINNFYPLVTLDYYLKFTITKNYREVIIDSCAIG